MAAEDPEKAMDVTDGSEEEDHDDDAGPDAKTLTSELLKNPAVMSALQGKLDSMVGTPSGYIKVNGLDALKALPELTFKSVIPALVLGNLWTRSITLVKVNGRVELRQLTSFSLISDPISPRGTSVKVINM